MVLQGDDRSGMEKDPGRLATDQPDDERTVGTGEIRQGVFVGLYF